MHGHRVQIKGELIKHMKELPMERHATSTQGGTEVLINLRAIQLHITAILISPGTKEEKDAEIAAYLQWIVDHEVHHNFGAADEKDPAKSPYATSNLMNAYSSVGNASGAVAKDPAMLQMNEFLSSISTVPN